MLVVLLAGSCALAMTPEEELEAWKKEPAYGKTIKVGYNGGLCTGTLGLTQVKGFYAAEGLDVELVRYQGDTVTLGDALGTGKIDIAGGHIATLLVPAANGVQMKFTTGMHTGCKSLCVLASSPYKTTKDLIGKTIAITTSIGGSDHNITMRFLLHDGIDPVRGVKYKSTDSGAAVLAMQNGEIAAALLSDQFIQKFLEDGTLRIIRSITFDDDFKDETCCVFAISKNIVENSPITARKLTQAHENCRKWIMANREEAVKLMLEHKWASGQFEKVLAFYNTLDYSVTDEVTEATLRKVIDDYKACGILDKNRDTEEVLRMVWDGVLMHK
ncbi:MAG: ABC transporter substrate-binding protein [Synergistaceae bacterium]|nr:ABC transporter substrate-binding protein [Synergistaceae bacterium]